MIAPVVIWRVVRFRTIARNACRTTYAALVLACADGRPEAEPATEVITRSAPTLSPDSTRVAEPLATTPVELAAACIGGDPIEGVPWSLAGIAAAPLALVSISSLAPRDSARLAARISAAVDVLPSDTSVTDFRGLPVNVRSAWRLAPSEGDTIVVALVSRRVPIESAPLEEIFAVIAAPGSRQGVRHPLLAGWVTRDAGREVDLAVRELVGTFRSGNDPALVLAHDAMSGAHAEVIVRRDGRWRLEWSGALPACDAEPRPR